MRPYLEANTYGIGELITQRKLFSVPVYQRAYAWEEENVSQFINDIIAAFEEDNEYFIGLLVLLNRASSKWEILDGQQRLATTTMIYSAIKHWLVVNNYADDAVQIETEFISVRQLGGDIHPRLSLSGSDHELFVELIIKNYSSENIKELRQEKRKYSNRLLIDALLKCRELIDSFAKKGKSQKEEISLLFKLANYIEKRVKVVVVDVSSESNAFVIFESLNARGNELSVLDLVKNYIFSQSLPEGYEDLRKKWQLMIDGIEDKSADDFLKVFWTSRFGRIQLPDLYEEIKISYKGTVGANNLMSDLIDAAEYYAALDDPSHELWNDFGLTCSQKYEDLLLLSSKQVRAPLMSALRQFDKILMAALLDALTVLIVRYQVVGKRRTGMLEIVCARLAEAIHKEEIKSEKGIWEQLNSIMPPDSEFRSDFLRFTEKKISRAKYMLLQLERTAEREGTSTLNKLSERKHPLSSDLIVEHILPKKPTDLWRDINIVDRTIHEDCSNMLGNMILIENSIYNNNMQNEGFQKKYNDYLTKSQIRLTRKISNVIAWNRTAINYRQEQLSKLAVITWEIHK